MAWTTPRTWVAGELVTAALANTHWRDNLALLKTSVSDDGTTWQGKLRALLTEQTITATGTQHDVSIAVGVTYLRVNNASALTITGFSIGGATPTSTACIILDAVGADAVTIAHQNAGSTAAYRVIAPDAADLVVPVGGRTMLLYDGTTGRWRAVFGGAQSNEFASGLLTDSIDELTPAAGVDIDGVLLKDGAVTGDIKTDSIAEETAASGVTVDGVVLKDGGISLAGALAASGQIAFPGTQVPSANANTLDDYEEGSWTPNDQSGAGLSFSTTEGRYVKIGQLVLACCTVTYPATASGLQAKIGGLPFSVTTTTNNISGGYTSYSSYGTPFTTLLVTGTTRFELYHYGGGTVTNANVTGAIIRFTAVYRASA